ncbi:gliding motility-associated C-terminal domain-containing protein [Pedobacter paludis]|nr:gliding motility-associated C-terminal domain-containing protein [Pedobacter paludis]
MKIKLLLIISVLTLFVLGKANAQQYKWAKNGGSAATLSSSNSISVNSANETWIAPSTTSLNQFKDASGAITTINGARIAKFDANMNMLWNAGMPTGANTVQIAADPDDPSIFYMVFQAQLSSGGVTYGATTLTGQAAALTTVLVKCQSTGTGMGGSYTYIWARKIDGVSDDNVAGIKVRKIGGTTKIALQGYTRSPKITNYGPSSVAAQEITLPAGGGAVYDQYISCYDGSGTPLWINTFGAQAVSEISSNAFDINDDGDVIYSAFEGGNVLGSQAYILNNSSGAAPGTVTSTTYTANVTTQRFILFNFKANNGTIQWAYDRLSTSSGNNANPISITTDAGKNVYINFVFSGSWHPTGVVSPLTITSSGLTDLGLVVVDNTGTPIRSQHYGGTGNDLASQFQNGLALDRTSNLLYMVGQTTTNFTTGTATVAGSGTYTGFLLGVNSTGTMSAVSAVTINSSVASFTDYYGSVGVLSNGDVIGVGQYAVSASNSVNGGAAVMPKTAYGYGDIAMTRFSSSTLVPTGAEAGWGARIAASIGAVAMQGNKLISGGTFSGTMTLGPTTLTAGSNSSFIAVTDTLSGSITAAYNVLGASNSLADMKVNPTDGSIYMLVGAGGNILPPGATSRGNTISGGKNQAYIIKLNSSYVYQWTAVLNGTEATNPTILNVDPTTGDVYVSGNFTSPSIKWVNDANTISTDIASNSNTGLPISQDVFVAKFNSAGIYQWITTGGNPSNAVNDGNSANKGLIFSGGSVYAGFSSANNAGETFSFGGQSFVTAPTATRGASDMALIKLNASTGVADWIKNWGGGSALEPITSLGVYGGNVYVAGYSSGNITNFGAAGSFVTVGGNDAFVFAVDATTGIEQAVPLARIGGNGSDVINAIDIDAIGNIFYIGSTSTTTATTAFPYVTSGSSDWLTGSLEASTLTPKFTFVNGSVGQDGGNGIIHGKPGTLFTGGQLLNNANFGAAGTLIASSAGEYAYARIDYPYIAPGAAVSNLNAWYKANAAVTLTGANVTQWKNSTTNSALTTLNNTGTVPFASSVINYNPSLKITGTTNYLSQNNISSPDFLNAAGNQYTVYTVIKPATASSLTLWSEPTTNTSLSIGATGVTVTGTGGAKTATISPDLSTVNNYSLIATTVAGGTIRTFVNGVANGTQTGATALSTTNPGTFGINGSGTTDVAEVVTYGLAHAAGATNMNQINTYFGLKYGITLASNYYDTEGNLLFNADGAGTTYLYDNNIAGLGFDENERLVQAQGISQNTANKGNMITIGLGTVATDNVSNVNTPASAGLSYLVWGDNAGDVATASSAGLPTGASSCSTRLARQWQVNHTGVALGATQTKIDLTGTALAGTSAANVKLLIDQDGDGNFTTGTITTITATSVTANVATFDNVAWDADANGKDIFAVASMPAAPVLAVTNPSSVNMPATVNITLPAVTAGSDTGAGFAYTYWKDAAATALPMTNAEASAIAVGGTYYIKLTNTSTGCFVIMPVVVTITGDATVTLTSLSADATKCINNAIANTEINFLTTNTTAASITSGSLPTGVNLVFDAPTQTIKIYGIPTVSGSFPYTVTVTGAGASASASGTITINPDATNILTSAPGTDSQHPCSGNSITDITYAITNQSSVTLSPALPSGLTSSFSGGLFRIYGTPTTSGVYNYTLTATSGCLSAVKTGSISVNDLPNAPTVSVSQTACGTPTGGISITAVAGETYSINGGGYTINTIYNGLAPGSYSILAKNGNGCISATSTDVTINAAPVTANAPAVSVTAQPICGTPTGSISITAVAGETYSVDGSAYTSALTYSGLAPGSHSILAKSADGCTSTATNITINPAKATANAPAVAVTAQPVCGTPTGSIGITAVAGETYSVDGGAYSATLTYSGLAPGPHAVTAKSADGCTSTATNITINPAKAVANAPLVSVTAQPVCGTPTGSIAITGVAGETYSVDGSAYTATLTYAGLAPGSHSILAKSADGCTSTATNITISPAKATANAPAVSVTAQPVCGTPTGSISITAVAGETYSVDGSAYTSTLTYSGLAPGPHAVTAKSSDGCTSTATNITINPAKATANAPAVAVTAQPVCGTATGSIAITGVTDETYSIDGGAYSASLTYAGLTPGTHIVKARSIDGCVSTGTDVVIGPAKVVAAAPVVTVTAQPTCALATGSISIAGVTGNTYSLDGSAYTATLTYSGLASGSHTVTAKSADGCISNAANITISAQPATPVATIAYGSAQYQAVGTASVIQTGQTGGTYTASPSGLGISGTTGAIDLGASTPNQTYTVTYTFSNGSCTGTATATVRVNSTPATIAYAKPAYCAGGTADIIRTGPADGTYTASGSGLRINASTGTINLGASTPGSYTVTYTYRDGTITATAVTTVTVNAMPVVSVSSDLGTDISKGDIVTLTAAGGTSYSWSGPDIQSGQNTGTLKVRPRQTATYTVTATSASGCSDIVQITITVTDDFKVVPNNVITPNGDGKNDTWVVKNLDYYPNNTVGIYDRAGRKVYGTSSYKNDWDGTYNGQPLAEGAYIYVIDLGKGIGLLRGTISIIRDNR